MPGKPRRPSKRPNLLADVRLKLAAGAFRDTRHATDRKAERAISMREVREAMESGWHEARKDEYRVEYGAWNHVVRGKTLDQRSLRVVISFDEEDVLLIITTIDLDA